MRKSAKPTASQDDTDNLTAAVERLADEIAVLRQALDEFRENFRWAANNDRLCVSNDQPEADISAQLDERLAGLADEVAEVVHDQLKRELSDLRNSLDDFSTDVTWAARQIRNGSHRAGSPNSEPVTATPPVDAERPAPSLQPTSHLTASGRQQRSLWNQPIDTTPENPA